MSNQVTLHAVIAPLESVLHHFTKRLVASSLMSKTFIWVSSGIFIQSVHFLIFFTDSSPSDSWGVCLLLMTCWLWLKHYHCYLYLLVVAWADGQLEAPFLFSRTFFNLPDSTHTQVEVRRAFYNALLYSTIATTLQYFKALNVDVKPLFWEYARLAILRCHLWDYHSSMCGKTLMLS